MSALDSLADRAQAASERLAGSDGIKGRLADELADDAAFLRKLKPRLIAKRVKGEAATDRSPEQAPAAPSGPQLGAAPKKPAEPKQGGPNPFLVVGAALVVGVALAKWIDWRGHAHPRR
jgi:hypothetical protein